MSRIDLSRLPACVEDARRAWQDEDPGPPDPTDYADLLTRLAAARAKLPPLYRTTAADPFVAALADLGAGRFAELLASDPQREGTAGPLLDIAQAILQNGEGHEVGGHDILHADDGLPRELARRVRAALVAAKLPADLAAYWSSRIDETASDVLGVLNLGPAAAVGLIAYFRGIRAAFGDGPTLANDGAAADPHPADIVRGWLAAETVRLLEFAAAPAWAEAIAKETDKDAGRIRLAGRTVTKARARKSAAIVARTIATDRLAALDGHALAEIQNWRDSDEAVAVKLARSLATRAGLPPDYASGTYAAHVVAAAVMAALGKGAAIPAIFGRMLDMLKVMHDANPSWGPLFVAHPGDIAREFAFARRGSGSRLG